MKTLLLIDDEEHISAAMAEYFAAHGYDVACARDESAALTLLEQTDFRIVITDLRLSRSDRFEGLDILERIRTRCPHTACIVLTACGFPDNEERARQRGARAFLQKPRPLEEIFRIVATLDRE
jgi:CheY-like chemotaxis protein